ncbi:MAG: cytidylate kinase-like family protein [Planctomycetia bacterium]|nr:cytidylate kinase-like family protein [Planctomycetia bacterium]
MTGTMSRSLDALDSLHHRLTAEMTVPPGSTDKPAAQALTIALSRQAGSGGSDIAKEVGRLLDWPVYDNELLTRIALEKGLSARMLEGLDERHVSWLEQAIHSFSKGGPLDGRYLNGLLRVLASLSKSGHCVIVGRGASHVLPPDTTLGVRVVAPRAWRVGQVQKRMDLSAADAEQWVNEHDRERLAFVQAHFHADATDPTLYDMILNGQRLGTTDAASLIVQAARAFEARLVAKSTG